MGISKSDFSSSKVQAWYQDILDSYKYFKGIEKMLDRQKLIYVKQYLDDIRNNVDVIINIKSKAEEKMKAYEELNSNYGKLMSLATQNQNCQEATRAVVDAELMMLNAGINPGKIEYTLTVEPSN